MTSAGIRRTKRPQTFAKNQTLQIDLGKKKNGKVVAKCQMNKKKTPSKKGTRKTPLKQSKKPAHKTPVKQNRVRRNLAFDQNDAKKKPKTPKKTSPKKPVEHSVRISQFFLLCCDVLGKTANL